MVVDPGGMLPLALRLASCLVWFWSSLVYSARGASVRGPPVHQWRVRQLGLGGAAPLVRPLVPCRVMLLFFFELVVVSWVRWSYVGPGYLIIEGCTIFSSILIQNVQGMILKKRR
jgi:hypothetical protein